MKLIAKTKGEKVAIEIAKAFRLYGDQGTMSFVRLMRELAGVSLQQAGYWVRVAKAMAEREERLKCLFESPQEQLRDVERKVDRLTKGTAYVRTTQ
jgi:hypothetical protein